MPIALLALLAAAAAAGEPASPGTDRADAVPAAPAPAPEPPDPGPPPEGAPVVRVEVEGNRRTRERTILRALRLAPGEPYTAALAAHLEQRLMNLRIFRSASVRAVASPDGAGAVLRVRVEERLTLIPVPVLAASRGVFTAGLTVLDANLRGGGEQLVVGALGSTRGASAFGVYRDPGVAGSRWLLALDAMAQDVRRERYDGQAEVYAYRDRRLDLGAGFGRQFDEHWAARVGWFETRDEASATGGYPPPPEAGPIHGPTLDVELTGDLYRLYYASGVSGRLRLRQGLALAGGDREVRLASAQLTWAGSAFRDHAVSITAAVDDVHGDPVLDAVRLGGRPGSRGFVSGGLWAETAATAALEYQVPVWRPGWGVVTVAGFGDAGAVRWQGQTTRYLAPGIGLRLYLRNVAIPVLGFDVAWATGQPAPLPSVLLGFRG